MTTDLTNDEQSLRQRKRLFIETKENSYYNEIIVRLGYRPIDENNSNAVVPYMIIVLVEKESLLEL